MNAHYNIYDYILIWVASITLIKSQNYTIKSHAKIRFISGSIFFISQCVFFSLSSHCLSMFSSRLLFLLHSHSSLLSFCPTPPQPLFLALYCRFLSLLSSHSLSTSSHSSTSSLHSPFRILSTSRLYSRLPHYNSLQSHSFFSSSIANSFFVFFQVFSRFQFECF